MWATISASTVYATNYPFRASLSHERCWRMIQQRCLRHIHIRDDLCSISQVIWAALGSKLLAQISHR